MREFMILDPPQEGQPKIVRKQIVAANKIELLHLPWWRKPVLACRVPSASHLCKKRPRKDTAAYSRQNALCSQLPVNPRPHRSLLVSLAPKAQAW